MPCRICNYNQVNDIDRAFLAGATPASLNKTSTSFSLPELQRHQQHLQEKMAQAQNRFHHTLQQGLFLKLHLVMEMVLSVVQGARAGEDFKLFLQASREFTRIIGLMHKIAVPLDPELLYCLMSSPQWDLQENSLLPNSFEALSKTRQTLKVNLFSHCPDPEPEPNPDQMPTTTPGTRNSELETPHIRLADAIPRLHLPETQNQKLETSRDTSAKLARN